MKFKLWIAGIFFAPPFSHPLADSVTVAVAANFAAPMKAIAEQFQATSSYRVVLVFGSSGKFYAQVKNGAPYDAFLSADQNKPQALIENGLALADSRFTYAIGALTLWSRNTALVDDSGAVLTNNNFRKLAIANPRVAPYGTAAMEVLEGLGIREKLNTSIVYGESITQTYQFVSSGNADVGFVALSQVLVDGKLANGSGWIVPKSLYSPIQQDAVLLSRGKNNEAARELLVFLKGKVARSIIAKFGYSSPQT